MCIRDRVINVEYWQEQITERQIQNLRLIFKSYNIERGFIEINTERGIQQSLSRQHGFNKVLPWTTTRKNKPNMIQDLAKDLEDRKLKLPTARLCPEMFQELGDYMAEHRPDGYIKYNAPDGLHDDFVISLALANQAREPHKYRGKYWVV